jgi:hypothetical protein
MVARSIRERGLTLTARSWILLAAALAVAMFTLSVNAEARRIEKYSTGAHTAASKHAAKPAAHTAPASSESTESPASASGSTEESTGASLSSEGDPLAENGLDSPFCHSPHVLSPPAQRNCETSDFVAAADPTGNYAFDVNINTGIANWGNDISATIENFLQFGWIALVALVHGMLVMFEWCYSPGLISNSTMSEIAKALHETKLTFTRPWMVLVLAIASVLALYHGLIRRRVAETLGQVLMMLAMMIGGLWVIADPSGTVGVVGEWANSSSLSTLSAVTSSEPKSGERTLAQQMQNVFSTVISGPWCYLEFGNEKWCNEPGQRDKRLRAAGLKIAEEEKEQSKCGSTCGAEASREDKDLAMSAKLLTSARSNGELFLALPANQKQRNSVNTEGSLLNVLCEEPKSKGEETKSKSEETKSKGEESKSADRCQSNTAPEAEFRTERGTGARVIGLILIWVGALGMLLLFGFLAFRLLEAAIASLFYLLLAPAAVLAPALGDGGRSAFRAWGIRLLGAFISKLIYSFLLGVVLLMMHILTQIAVLGWWAQWLLMSALWWVTLHHRHKILGFAHGTQHGHETGSMRWYYRIRMAQDVGRAAGWARKKFASPPPGTNRSLQVPPAQSERLTRPGSNGPHAPSTGAAGTLRRPNEINQDSADQAVTGRERDSEDSPERSAPEVRQAREEDQESGLLDEDSRVRYTDAAAEDDDFEDHVTPPPNASRHSGEVAAWDRDEAPSLESAEPQASRPDAPPTPAPQTAGANPETSRHEGSDPRHEAGSSSEQRPSGRQTPHEESKEHSSDTHKRPVPAAEESSAPSARSTEETSPRAKGTREGIPGSHLPRKRGLQNGPGPAAKQDRHAQDATGRQRLSRRARGETPYEMLARQLNDKEKPPRRGAGPPPGTPSK